MTSAIAFWQNTALADMSPAQWESLCDGCALCCLQKLEDADTGEIYYTDVACQQLDTQRCQCTTYSDRQARVEQCLVLTADNLPDAMVWLPDTCAYKRLANGQPLPPWHPLLTGTTDSVHRARASVRGRCVSESQVDPDTLEDRIVFWVSGFGK